ncbi:UNKNOWN [Stylonychia lemnae]|uniref:Uncharacterized protein n=1 Tax=Stylonychia lemnae TaxID=5949 RepID=A0A077ZSF3_STYLE|nr:UNKNOWN [Stylonychia lemnae]|eukprot:CDW72474.1 UNKNOWN [Stylonychia lemnae]
MEKQQQPSANQTPQKSIRNSSNDSSHKAKINPPFMTPVLKLHHQSINGVKKTSQHHHHDSQSNLSPAKKIQSSGRLQSDKPSRLKDGQSGYSQQSNNPTPNSSIKFTNGSGKQSQLEVRKLNNIPGIALGGPNQSNQNKIGSPDKRSRQMTHAMLNQSMSENNINDIANSSQFIDDPRNQSMLNSARDDKLNKRQIYFSSNERLDLIIQTSQQLQTIPQDQPFEDDNQVFSSQEFFGNNNNHQEEEKPEIMSLSSSQYFHGRNAQLYAMFIEEGHMRKQSQSTEKLISTNHNQINFIGRNQDPNNSSMSSINFKQRRSRTQRKEMRQMSSEATSRHNTNKKNANQPDQAHQQNPGLIEIGDQKIKIEDLIVNHSIIELEQEAHRDKTGGKDLLKLKLTTQPPQAEDFDSQNNLVSQSFRIIDEINTVDDFAKSLINNNLLQESHRKDSSINNTFDQPHIKDIKNNINKAGNFQDEKLSVDFVQEFNALNTSYQQTNHVQDNSVNYMSQGNQLNNKQTNNNYLSQQKINTDYDTEQQIVKPNHTSVMKHVNYKESTNIPQSVKHSNANPGLGGIQNNANAGVQNLNEDINHLELAQLYGQISMFDQLTDYNEYDNDEQQNFSPTRNKKQTSDDGEDRGEDDIDDEQSNNLRQYRHRIQDINEDIQSDIDYGEDGDENVGESSNKVHNLQVNTNHDNSNHMVFQDNDDDLGSLIQVEEKILQQAQSIKPSASQLQVPQSQILEDSSIIEQEQDYIIQMTPMNQQSIFQDDEIIAKQSQQITAMVDKIQQMSTKMQGLELQVQQQALQIQVRENKYNEIAKEKEALQTIIQVKAEQEQASQSYIAKLKEENKDILNKLSLQESTYIEIQSQNEELIQENHVLKAKLTHFFTLQESFQNQQRSAPTLDDQILNSSPSFKSQQISFRKYKIQSSIVSPKDQNNILNKINNCEGIQQLKKSAQRKGSRQDEKRNSSLIKQTHESFTSQQSGRTILERIISQKSDTNLKLSMIAQGFSMSHHKPKTTEAMRLSQQIINQSANTNIKQSIHSTPNKISKTNMNAHRQGFFDSGSKRSSQVIKNSNSNVQSSGKVTVSAFAAIKMQSEQNITRDQKLINTPEQFNGQAIYQIKEKISHNKHRTSPLKKHGSEGSTKY